MRGVCCRTGKVSVTCVARKSVAGQGKQGESKENIDTREWPEIVIVGRWVDGLTIIFIIFIIADVVWWW